MSKYSSKRASLKRFNFKRIKETVSKEMRAEAQAYLNDIGVEVRVPDSYPKGFTLGCVQKVLEIHAGTTKWENTKKHHEIFDDVEMANVLIGLDRGFPLEQALAEAPEYSFSGVPNARERTRYLWQ